VGEKELTNGIRMLQLGKYVVVQVKPQTPESLKVGRLHSIIELLQNSFRTEVLVLLSALLQVEGLQGAGETSKN